jgi:hypothetical protein
MKARPGLSVKGNLGVVGPWSSLAYNSAGCVSAWKKGL